MECVLERFCLFKDALRKSCHKKVCKIQKKTSGLDYSFIKLQAYQHFCRTTLGLPLRTFHRWIKFQSLYKKWDFPLWISSVKMNKFAGNYGFAQIYWRNPSWKTSFFVQWVMLKICLFNIKGECIKDLAMLIWWSFFQKIINC